MKYAPLLIVLLLGGCVHPGNGVDRRGMRRTPDATLVLEPVRIDGQQSLAYLVAELQINGYPGRFMIDTGASHGWIHPDYAKRLGMNVGGTFNNIGAGPKSVPKAYLDSYDFGFTKVTGLYFRLGDLFEYANAQLPATKKIDGLIGLDLLTLLSAEIDVGSRTMVFFKPAK